MASDQTKTIAGAVLILAGAALLVSIGILQLSVPIALAALATIGIALGALLIGTTGEGPAV